MRTLIKWGKISVAEVGMKCKTPLMREAFTHNKLFSQFAFFGFIMGLVWFGKITAGYPIGGSVPLARRFERKYLDLGGRIHYESKVTRIIVEDNKAKGIELENGQQFDSDIVISAADGHCTIYEMLQGKYTDKKIEELYAGKNKMLTPYPSLVYVSLGVARKLDDLPHQVIYQLKEPLLVDDTMEHSALNTTLYHFDPTLAPEGKTCVMVMFETYGHEYWTNLRNTDRQKYNKEKNRLE